MNPYIKSKLVSFIFHASLKKITKVAREVARNKNGVKHNA